MKTLKEYIAKKHLVAKHDNFLPDNVNPTVQLCIWTNTDDIKAVSKDVNNVINKSHFVGTVYYDADIEPDEESCFVTLFTAESDFNVAEKQLLAVGYELQNNSDIDYEFDGVETI